MIDSTKLIPRRSKTSVLSPSSLINLNVIRRDTKKIDDLLKERLVLSKIRYGIEKQQLERSIRGGTESRLEKSDDKKDYDIGNDPTPRKPKPGLGGLLGGLFKGIISSIGGVAFTVVPLLLRFSKIFTKVLNPFTLITGTIFGAISLITRLTSSEGSKLGGKDVDQVRGNNLSNTFTGFTDALSNLAFSIIAGAVASRAINNIRTANLRAQLKGKISDEQARLFVQKEALAQRFQSGKKAGIRRGIQIGEEKGFNRGFKAGLESFEEIGSIDRSTEGRRIDKKLIKTKTKTGREIMVGGDRLGVSARDSKFFQELGLDPSMGRRGADPREILAQQRILNEKILAREIGLEDRFERERIEQSIVDQRISDADEFVGVDEETGELIKKKKKSRRARRRRPSKTVEQIKADIDARNPTFTGKSGGKLPMKGKMKADFLAKKGARKGLGKFMSKIGGRQFIKPIRKFISEGIGTIPIIGDLIALLLDVFVFGEPVGRAAFMAGGSILGGFLGGLAGAIGGPPGVLIGSIIGGIGGDLLGAAFYDLIFRRKQNIGGRLPFSALKGASKGALMKGGFADFGIFTLGEAGREFVLDADSTAALERRSPGFLMALNNARGDSAIEVLRNYASYEGSSVGKESMIPIPFPIPSKESTGDQQIVMESSSGARHLSFISDLYRRG